MFDNETFAKKHWPRATTFVKKHWPRATHIGSGACGSAYKLGNKVIKITGSFSEARTSAFLKKNPTPLSVRIYSVYRVWRYHWLIVRAYAEQADYSDQYLYPLVKQLNKHLSERTSRDVYIDSHPGNWGTIAGKPVCFDVDASGLPPLKIPGFKAERKHHANY